MYLLFYNNEHNNVTRRATIFVFLEYANNPASPLEEDEDDDDDDDDEDEDESVA